MSIFRHAVRRRIALLGLTATLGGATIVLPIVLISRDHIGSAAFGDPSASSTTASDPYELLKDAATALQATRSMTATFTERSTSLQGTRTETGRMSMRRPGTWSADTNIMSPKGKSSYMGYRCDGTNMTIIINQVYAAGPIPHAQRSTLGSLPYMDDFFDPSLSPAAVVAGAKTAGVLHTLRVDPDERLDDGVLYHVVEAAYTGFNGYGTISQVSRKFYIGGDRLIHRLDEKDSGLRDPSQFSESITYTGFDKPIPDSDFALPAGVTKGK